MTAPPTWPDARADHRAPRPVTLAAGSFESPIGRLGLFATEAGLAKVAFEAEEADQTARMVAEQLGATPVDQPERLDPVKRQLEQYFDRGRRIFDLKLDLSLIHGFTLAVIKRLNILPYGRTISYGDIAKAVGQPDAARAVGRACSANPVPVVVPCHRVVRGDGAVGGFGGGIEIKKALLHLEGVKLQ
ncbi:MAG: methylated-DNA--[protein]-cysteine S-methyltransferase [Bifidobacteriaceae bacterium]|nr:methylated-DNA--[protein]-cysteine S-methyltransferase [Bifidobacteriaceae bacterium]